MGHWNEDAGAEVFEHPCIVYGKVKIQTTSRVQEVCQNVENTAFPSSFSFFFFLRALIFFLKILFIFRQEGREKERERNINVWLPLPCPSTVDLAHNQARALSGTQTSNLLGHRPLLNLLSHTSQGPSSFSMEF